MIGRIYKITNADESVIYIGATKLQLKERFNRHKSDYKRWANGTHHCSAMIYHNFLSDGIDNYDIHLIAEHEVTNKRELDRLEQEQINRHNCVNRIRSHR